MSLLDYYIPEEALHYPHCGANLVDWQGKDGPCGLLVWRQGEAHSVDQRVDDKIKWPPEELQRFLLPERFVIFTSCCSRNFP